jgi:hypothetical protein
MRSRIYIRLVVLVCALCAGLAACSSSSSTPAATSATSGSSTPYASSPAATTAPSPTPSVSANPATEQTIAANWTAFFNPKVSSAKRLGLLENGQQLATALKSLDNSPTSALTTAKVKSVTMISATQAKVTYDLLLSGKPVLTNQSGIAVLQDGTWKVGTATLCGLLALNAGGNTKSLPAACQSAG